MKFVCLFGAAFVYFLVLGFVICCTDVVCFFFGVYENDVYNQNVCLEI